MLEKLILKPIKNLVLVASLTSILHCGEETHLTKQQDPDAGIYDSGRVFYTDAETGYADAISYEQDTGVPEDCTPTAQAGPDLDLNLNEPYCLNFTNQSSPNCNGYTIPQGHEQGTGSQGKCGNGLMKYQLCPDYMNNPASCATQRLNGTFNVESPSPGKRVIKVQVEDSARNIATDTATITWR